VFNASGESGKKISPVHQDGLLPLGIIVENFHSPHPQPSLLDCCETTVHPIAGW